MKFSVPVLLLVACLTALLLALAGCNYIKPMMYVDIANHSGRSMENLEVKCPFGSFGLPELRNEQTHRRMITIATPCKFRIAFQDQSGKNYAQEYNLGSRCPTEVAFEAGSGMSITERVVRP
jgi:hypothetical protein